MKVSIIGFAAVNSPIWPANPSLSLMETEPLPIYLNTLFSWEKQAERLKHEIKHLTEEHFYRADLSINQIERQADGLERA